MIFIKINYLIVYNNFFMYFLYKKLRKNITLDNKFYYLLFYSFFRICQPRTFCGYNFRFCPPSADLFTKGAGSIQSCVNCKQTNYLLDHCGARLAFFKPYFFLSTFLASLVKYPALLNRFLKSKLNSTMARLIPNLIASAWALIPPPET